MSDKASAVESLKEEEWRSIWKDSATLQFFCIVRQRLDSHWEVHNL